MGMVMKRFLAVNGVSQADVARGIGVSTAFVSQLVAGESGARQETIHALLAFLSGRLGRQVTYEELFPAQLVQDAPESGQ